MSAIRLVLLWHMHQPFYKDLVTNEYRLPWVRLHALKDYFGMVKMVDEFPEVHQTFNLVPSLVAQIEDYAAGTAHDPFFELAARPAAEMSADERQLALRYFFQAHETNMIGRYARYRELRERFRSHGDNEEKAERYFRAEDITDLQVLSQLAWFDEYFLDEPEVEKLVRKGRGFDREEQQRITGFERELMGRVLPAYASAAQRGLVELSTSPFYHPILPLVCDTDAGRASSPGLPLPQRRFKHPEDAREQLRRAIELHQRVFGLKPRGVWPSEGSVSEEVLKLAAEVGIGWMAADEGVLGRTQGRHFQRDAEGRLSGDDASRLFRVYRYEAGIAPVHLLFRDHAISDLIGFVYSNMPAADAARHFIQRLKDCAQPLLSHGKDCTVPVILDGENAWEFYPRSGREFLRRVYEAVSQDPQIEAVTVSEAIAREQEFGKLESLVPGSWIDANFNVWIGAWEDNRAWDLLGAARDFYSEKAPQAREEQRALALEELLIAEGSDWNWWYGPEHHSANDREFDELYRKHLANVYQALGSEPPEEFAQPIPAAFKPRPQYIPQAAYIHPRIDGWTTGYFDWLGAAFCAADHRTSAMHGKQFVLESFQAGLGEEDLYGRVDLVPGGSRERLELTIHLESEARKLRLTATLEDQNLLAWKLSESVDGAESASDKAGTVVRLMQTFEFKLPLERLATAPGGRIRMRCAATRAGLPLDQLPAEGWLELRLISEEEMAAQLYGT